MTVKEAEALLADAPDDQKLWLDYARALHNEGKTSEAVDAALRSWILSRQQNEEAVHMAVSLLPSADLETGLPLDEADHACMAAALIRWELEKKLGLAPSDEQHL